MNTATKNQVIAINTAITKKGLKDQKKQMILDVTQGRTESSGALSFDEAHQLLQFLNADTDNTQESIDKQVRKLFALAYDINWIRDRPTVGPGGKVTTKKDFSTVYEWVKKFGYLKKELRDYNEKELPKLITQFQQGPHAYYLKK
jgi:hypothetical protein